MQSKVPFKQQIQYVSLCAYAINISFSLSHVIPILAYEFKLSSLHHAISTMSITYSKGTKGI